MSYEFETIPSYYFLGSPTGQSIREDLKKMDRIK